MTTKRSYAYREQWLSEAIHKLESSFNEAGYTYPDKIRVSVGFPFGSRKAIGQHWGSVMSADGNHEHFISPVLSDPPQVLATLVHELVHAVVPEGSGHKTPFRRCALALGLAGKMTATHAGPELAARLEKLADRLGPYPHASLKPVREKKEGTRLIKACCPDCGYTIRITNKWIIEAGLPDCPACDVRLEIS